MEDKFIIKKGEEILGYLNTEKETKEIIDKLVDIIIEDEKRNEGIRIFSEKITNGVNIYKQELGTIFNGPVILIHNISYLILKTYKI